MAEKNKVRVMIEGKMITLGGYESQEYLERVAFYVNKKIAELSSIPGYNRQTADMKSTLLALNITDDYFKAKARAEHLENDIEEKDETSYTIRQDLVNAQIRIQDLTAEIARLKSELASKENNPVSDEEYYFDDEDIETEEIIPATKYTTPVKSQRQSKRYVKNRNI